VVRKLLLTLRLNYDKYGKHQMTTLLTNRFFTKALRTLCCIGALATCSTWATVVNWELSASTSSPATVAQTSQSPLFASSNTPARPATELDDAMARTFDQGSVSGPTVQFASAAMASRNASGTNMAASGVEPVPVPEMSALFPIVGLIAAVSCTQILRRRRAAQQSAPRSVV
jgi:hypothetical protein